MSHMSHILHVQINSNKNLCVKQEKQNQIKRSLNKILERV